MNNNNLKNKNLMLDIDDLNKFDELVGKQQRSKVIRKLINAYIKNPNILISVKIKNE